MWILWILRIHLPQSPTTRTLSGIWDNTPLPGLDLHGRYHYPGAYDHQQPFVQPTEMEVCCTPLTTPPLFSVNTTKVGTILHTQNNGTNTPAPTTVRCHSYPTDVDAFNKVSVVFCKRDSSSSGYLDCKEFWGATSLTSSSVLLPSQNKQLFNEIDKDNSGQINHWWRTKWRWCTMRCSK